MAHRELQYGYPHRQGPEHERDSKAESFEGLETRQRPLKITPR